MDYRLYLAHASIELHVNGEPDVARRVLEHGLSKHESYITEPKYVLPYVEFLAQVSCLAPRRLASRVGSSDGHSLSSAIPIVGFGRCVGMSLERLRGLPFRAAASRRSGIIASGV